MGLARCLSCFHLLDRIYSLLYCQVSFAREFGAAERAAHLETCNSASRDGGESAPWSAIYRFYTSSSDAVCQAVRQCAEEVLGSANVLTELKGQVQDGSNKRPGDVTTGVCELTKIKLFFYHFFTIYFLNNAVAIQK